MSFIQTYRNKYTVKQMCKVLKFPRSTYYAVINHKPSQREQEYNEFSVQVLSVYTEFKKRYGAVKIQRELSDRGILCSVKRVQRHMRKFGMKSIVIKKLKAGKKTYFQVRAYNIDSAGKKVYSNKTVKKNAFIK